jgi:hypothetical protein
LYRLTSSAASGSGHRWVITGYDDAASVNELAKIVKSVFHRFLGDSAGRGSLNPSGQILMTIAASRRNMKPRDASNDPVSS